MIASSPIRLLSKAIKTKSWLWHRRLSHTSVSANNHLVRLVDDYSWFTWVKFIALKDEAPDFIIKFMKMIQIRLNATVRNICTDNGTEFVNQTLRDYYEQVFSLDMHPRRKLTVFTTDVPEKSLKPSMSIFDELTAMAFEQSSLEPALHEMICNTQFKTRSKPSSFSIICTIIEA
ncbi:retrovirus-related pol polyprotein from transposon TNT 1-94 [Tanacetum coccineum]